MRTNTVSMQSNAPAQPEAQRPPRVSIGLAVYNGEKYLESAIASILAQTFTDFELIIADNASTDRTGEIAQKYAAQDARIRYQRNPTNIGGANNENLTFRLARGQYFRWAAHDDRLAPTLLERCVEILDAHPEVVACYTAIVEIDQNDEYIQTTHRQKGIGATPHRRLRELAFRDHTCEAFYGLIRSEVLAQTRLQQNYTDSDRTLLSELALRGKFYEIPEPLFYKRYHPGNAYLDWRVRMSWFNPALKGRITFPNWQQAYDLWVTIHRVPLSWKERFLCTLVYLRWLLRYSRSMARDVVAALAMLIHSREWRVKYATSMSNWE